MYLGGNPADITDAYDIEDADYSAMFEANRKLFCKQQHDAPEKFLKDTHQYLADPGVKEEYRRLLQGKQRRFHESFGGKEEGKSDALAMVHGTSDSFGWKIARGGFGIVASVDSGYYGQGIYFTSKVKYAIGYTLEHPNPVLIISMVNPGNAFPVTEHPKRPGSLEGAKCKLGYQSHYCATGTGFFPTFDPVLELSLLLNSFSLQLYSLSLLLNSFPFLFLLPKVDR